MRISIVLYGLTLAVTSFFGIARCEASLRRQLVDVTTEEPVRDVRQLALFFNDLPSYFSVDDLHNMVAPRISEALDVDEAAIVFSPIIPPGLPFGLSNPEVTNSALTPETYTTFLSKWQTALTTNEALTAPLEMNGVVLTVDTSQYEISMTTAAPGDDVVSADQFEEGVDPPIISGDRAELLHALANRERVMQIRLSDSDLEEYYTSFGGLDRLVGGLREAASTLLGAEENNLVLFDIRPGSVRTQFTVYPASNLEEYESLWTEAIESNNPALSTIFVDVDFKYPATSSGPADVTTTTTVVTTTRTAAPGGRNNDSSGTNSGVVAGAVLGSVAGVALIGGGAAGYVYRQKHKARTTQPASGGQDFGERSPGAETISPTGLSNVDIRGEATPNPHNFNR